MKLSRDLAAADLEKAPRRALDYQFTRQSGSHRRLTTQMGGEHHLTIPATIRSNRVRCAPSWAK
jgi:hypothetical protein